jgi:hypothetical protein
MCPSTAAESGLLLRPLNIRSEFASESAASRGINNEVVVASTGRREASAVENSHNHNE